MQTLRFAIRQLARSPGFTAAALLTLALGIGFSAASFSITNAMLLRDLPYPDAGRLVRISRTTRQSQSLPHAPANLRDVRETATSFAATAAYNHTSLALGERGQGAAEATGMAVTAGFFDLLGVQPDRGRGFAPDEDRPGGPAVAIVTHRAWTGRFGADPGLVSRTIRLNGRPFTVIGILPAGFDAPLVWGPVDVITPMQLDPAGWSVRTGGWMSCIGRLGPGVTLRQARTELAAIAARLAQQYPKENAANGLHAAALHDANLAGASRALPTLLTGLSLMLLLIACANLAALQIARALARGHDHAVRTALGGSRRQLMMPLLTESLLLALGGGALGLLFASWANDVFVRRMPVLAQVGFQLPIDLRVVGFAIVVALASGLAFGLAPAWLASLVPGTDALQAGSRSATAHPAQQRLKRILVAGTLALALALVGAATSFGLGVRSFLRRPVGWEPDGVFHCRIVLPEEHYRDKDRQREFHRVLLERLGHLPGVTDAALATGVPLYSLDIMARTAGLIVEGRPPAEPGREPSVEASSVSADYFAALRIPLRQGALFPRELQAGDAPVAVINQALADRFWPGENPVGRRLRFPATNTLAASEQWFEVVGVVGDVGMLVRLDAPETRLQLYRPLVQLPSRYVAIVLRTAVPPASLASAVSRTVAALDPDLPVATPGSLRSWADAVLANMNIVIVNLAATAALGLLIAAVGLFGVVAQLATQRTREIGVRIALGATRADILGMILGEGVRLLAFGVAAGVPAFGALNLLVHRAMPEMHLPGPWLLVACLAVLTITTLLACLVPARRATRVDPVEALRAE